MTEFLYGAVSNLEIGGGGEEESRPIGDVGELELETRRVVSRTGGKKLEEAARYVVCAVSGERYVEPPSTAAGKLAYRWSQYLGDAVQEAAVPALLLIPVLERPRWCEDDEAQCSCTWDARNPSKCPYPTFDVPYLDTGVKLTLEICLLAVVASHQACLRLAMGRAGYWPERGAQFIAVVAAVLANAAFAMAKYGVVAFRYPGKVEEASFFLASYLRLGVFVSYSRAVRSQIQLAVRIVPHFLRVGSLICGLMSFFAWFGVVLFPNSTPENAATVSSEGDLYFPNFREAMWQLMVLITTANFPDVALPAYSENRWSMLFFAAFVTFGCFFIMNLVLATVYNVYTQERTKSDEAFEAMQHANLTAAFTSMAGSDDKAWIDAGEMRALFAELNAHHQISYISDQRSAFLLAELDASSDGHIDPDEFKQLCSVLQLDLNKVRASSERVRRERNETVGGSDGWANGPLSRLVGSRIFEYCVDALLVINAVVIAYQTRDELYGIPTTTEDSGETSLFWETIETAFALLYFFEMSLKIWAFGFRAYIALRRNKFDALVTVASLLTVLLVYSPNTVSDVNLIRYVLMVRLLRLVRLLASIPDYQVIAESFLNMLPAASRLLKLLFIVTFFFAIIGQSLFGGKINTDPNRPELALLKDTDYYKQGYLPLNFNDLFSSYVTLYSVLVVNNWQVLTDGFVAVAGLWARIYFIAFYAVGVLLCVNVSVAFILDSFISELEKTRNLKS